MALGVLLVELEDVLGEDKEVGLLLMVLAGGHAEVVVVLVALLDLEELHAGDGGGGVLAPVEDEGVLLYFYILYIFEIVLLDDFPGQFILDQFFAVGVC